MFDNKLDVFSLHPEEQLWMRVHVHGGASQLDQVGSGSWSCSVDTRELGRSKYVQVSFEPKTRACLKR